MGTKLEFQLLLLVSLKYSSKAESPINRSAKVVIRGPAKWISKWRDMGHWKGMSATMADWQEKFLNSRRSRMAKAVKSWPWWQLRKIVGWGEGGGMAPPSLHPRCHRPCISRNLTNSRHNHLFFLFIFLLFLFFILFLVYIKQKQALPFYLHNNSNWSYLLCWMNKKICIYNLGD